VKRATSAGETVTYSSKDLAEGGGGGQNLKDGRREQE